MNRLKEACMKFNEIQEEYRKFKEESCKLRERCDEKIREEMINFSKEMDEVAVGAEVLLNNFTHYGSLIRFAVEISEDKNDALIICFSKQEYSISKHCNEEVLYKSSCNIDEFPTASYEILILNKDIIIQKSMQKITMFLDSEINKMSQAMSEEHAYYDMLCSKLFPEEGSN